MKPIIKHTPKLVPKGYNAITIFPFVFVSEKWMLDDKRIITHESIHIEQQKELLVVVFFLWYFLNYLWNLVRYRNHLKAYVNIVFEREAYANEYDFNYLKNRKRFAFLKYLNKKYEL